MNIHMYQSRIINKQLRIFTSDKNNKRSQLEF